MCAATSILEAQHFVFLHEAAFDAPPISGHTRPCSVASFSEPHATNSSHANVTCKNTTCLTMIYKILQRKTHQKHFKNYDGQAANFNSKAGI